MNIEQKIKGFILNNLYFAESSALSDDVSFLAEGIIDSMGALELVTFVETEFGIKVEMSEVVVRNFDSIRQLTNFVRRKLAATNGVPSKALAAVSATSPEQTVSMRSERADTSSQV